MTPLIKCIETVSGHNDRVWDIKWNPGGTLLASCGTDKTIRIWGKEGMVHYGIVQTALHIAYLFCIQLIEVKSEIHQQSYL